MRYLTSIREGFNDPSYCKLSESDFDKMLSGIIRFKSDIVMRIISYFEGYSLYKKVDFSLNSYWLSSDRKFINNDNFKKSDKVDLSMVDSLTISNYPENWHIQFFEDDWFVVTYIKYGDSSDFKRYKCDQFDGLVKLFKDKGVIDKSINESFDKEKYYQEVDNDESPLLKRDKFWDYEWVDLSQKVIDYLKRVIVYGWTINDSGRYRDISFIKLSMDVFSGGKYVVEISFTIFESKDEWFWVNQWTKGSLGLGYTNRTYRTYKCDQFEGLMEFLKSKGVIL